MAELDIRDRKLLYYLSQNSRISHTKLSEKLGLSKNAVKYRIERLLKDGIIKNFACTVNIGSLKLHTYTLLLKFNEDIYENKEIIEYFKKHAYADWVISLSGQWDLFVEIVIKNFSHLAKMIDEMIEHFGETLNTYQLFSSNDTLRVEHLVKDFYSDLNLMQIENKERTVKKFKIDEVDRKILSLLNEDSRLSFIELADRLNLTIDIVRYRIKNLIKNKIIIKFFPEISLPKLGYTKYLYMLKLKNLSKEKFKEIKNSIKNNNNVTYAFVDINSYNIIFECAYKSADGIDHLSRGLRNKYFDIIDKQEYLIIKEEILFNLFPKGLLKS